MGCDAESEPGDTRRRAVEKAMTTLSTGQRDAITLAYFSGCTYRQVARLLDLPEGTVKSRIRTGLRRIRQELDGLVTEFSEHPADWRTTESADPRSKAS
jgi:DNA-directed RNA polymerase specialized sigma24 family protein